MKKTADITEILGDKRVIEEIQKYLWIESEKAGHDIGLERATKEWLKHYGEEWTKYHMPEKYLMFKPAKKKRTVKKEVTKKSPAAKKKKATGKTRKRVLKKA